MNDLFGTLYLQGTQLNMQLHICLTRYIPVPTGNSEVNLEARRGRTVYPCTYRELCYGEN